jgi:thiamine monophosphate kinase
MAGRGEDPVITSMTSGDDYELVFAVPTRAGRRLAAVERLTRGLPLTRVGELTQGRDFLLVRDGKAEDLPFGFSHF